ncbi:MAG TPA: efflux RND transporter permease subunit, partial [Candidatus Brocadiaceae bacterium]
MLSRIIKYCLEHRLLVILVICLAIFFGVTAIFKTSTEFLPDLSSPIISVITENPGLAAQEVETLITRPIESALRSTPDVTGIRSNTMYGVSWVTLSFKWGTDYYFARQLITQNLTDVIPRLPMGTHAPILSNAASRLGEIVEYYIKGDLPPLDLRELANFDVRYRMLSVPGVWRVWNMGGEVR